MCGDRIHWIGYGLCGEPRNNPCLIVLDPLQSNQLCRGEIFEKHLKHLERRRAPILSRRLELLTQLRQCSAYELIGKKIRSNCDGGNRYTSTLEMPGGTAEYGHRTPRAAVL